MNFLTDAIEYHRRNWSIIPIARRGNGKTPPQWLRWKPYQERIPTEAEVRKWFAEPDLAGLAVILGQVSGGVYVRDFDDAMAFDAWASEHPAQAVLLPKVSTNRGAHLYFASKQAIRTKEFDDGELRGDGAYCLIPPSRHPSGHVYRWETPLTKGQLPVVDPAEAGFTRSWIGTQCTERTEKTELTTPPTPHLSSLSSSVHSVLSVQLGGVVEKDVLAALDRVQTVSDLASLAVPTGKSQNHKCLFKLARWTKAYEKKIGRKLSQTELMKTFNEWHTQAKPHLRHDQSKDEYGFEFLASYDHVKYPMGDGLLQRAWERAQNQKLPEVALQFDHPQIRLLVALCQELQRVAGDKPFPLACRVVQRLMKHETHTTANLWLNGLVRWKIIEVVEKGGPATNQSTKYRFLPPLEATP